jgi:outer membrane protein TolC
VNEIYFGLLLLDDKIALNHDMQELLLSSERQLAAMVKAGTAATSDLDAVKAQRLSVRQTEVELVSQKTALTQMLALFTGKPVTALSRPAVDSPAHAVNLRPELRLIDAQLRLPIPRAGSRCRPQAHPRGLCPGLLRLPGVQYV